MSAGSGEFTNSSQAVLLRQAAKHSKIILLQTAPDGYIQRIRRRRGGRKDAGTADYREAGAGCQKKREKNSRI